MTIKRAKKQLRTVLIRSKWFFIKRKNDFLHLRRWQQITSLALVLPLIGFSGYKLATPYVFLSDSKLYLKELQQIDKNVNEIQESISTREKLTDTDALHHYEKNLDNIIVSCNKINAQARPGTENEGSEKIRAIIRFCEDLRHVAIYQKNLYGQLAALLTIETQRMPQPENPKAYKTAVDIHNTLTHIMHNLPKINNGRFIDPAKDEIKNQLLNMHEQSSSLKSSNKVNPENYNRLVRSLGKTQEVLLIHKGYFWNNTADISNLSITIEKLIQKFD